MQGWIVLIGCIVPPRHRRNPHQRRRRRSLRCAPLSDATENSANDLAFDKVVEQVQFVQSKPQRGDRR
jgi:hypothetical protein